MSLPRIWVDADACPNMIKEVLFKAAQRLQLPLCLVANHALSTPNSPYIRSLQVSAGFDVADNYIVANMAPGDLIITADIPLAAELIEQGGNVINPRGERYTPDTIRQRLNMRDFMDTMRSSGEVRGGPPPLDARDKQQFANQLDRFLARLPRQ